MYDLNANTGNILENTISIIDIDTNMLKFFYSDLL